LGLYYLRARYYNPATGRFLSRDPEEGKAKIPASLHKYLYVGGNPVNWIDPRGREEMIDDEELTEDIAVKAEPSVAKEGWELALCFAGIGLTIHAITEDNPYVAGAEGAVAWAACFGMDFFTGPPPGPPPVTPPPEPWFPWPPPGTWMN
jgi:uncharacterized protein RhaS with RHS repeats